MSDRQTPAPAKFEMCKAYVLREPIAVGAEHLTVSGTFQSDKYPWCWAGFVPLKIGDPMAEDLLRIYAERRRIVDPVFSRELIATLDNAARGRKAKS